MSDCTCGCHPAIETCDRCCVKHKLLEEAKRENVALSERLGYLGQCLHIQSNILEKIDKIQKSAESIILNVETLEERIIKLESNHLGEKLNPEVWKFLTEKVDGLEIEINLVRALVSAHIILKKGT